MLRHRIKITLKYDRSRLDNQSYEVTKLVNAATVDYPNPADLNKTLTLRVGDKVNEKVATMLVEQTHEVTVV